MILRHQNPNLIVSHPRICDRWPAKSLDSPDNYHLSAAIGWLGLGNWQEANEELEMIELESRLVYNAGL